ncbi:MAG: AAA family ATPase, partial [Candidatus Aenigmatarchaeota archaeon]
QLIQATYASARDEIEKREIKALLKASKELRCKDLLIITWDYEGEIKVDRKSINCIPLWKWLLSF